MGEPDPASHLTQQLFQLSDNTKHCASTALWLLQHHAAHTELLPLISKSAASVPGFEASRNHVHLMHDVLSQFLGMRNAGNIPEVVSAIQSPLQRTAQACVAAAAGKATCSEQLANLSATVDLWSTHGAMSTMQVSLCKAALAAAGVRVAKGAETHQAAASTPSAAPDARQLAAVAAAATSLQRVPVGVMAQLVRSAFLGPAVPYAPIDTASLPPVPSSRLEPGRLQVRLSGLTNKNARDVQAERRRLARQAAAAAGLSAPSSRATGAPPPSNAYGGGGTSMPFVHTPAPIAAAPYGGQKRSRSSAYSGLGATASTGRIEIAAPVLPSSRPGPGALEQQLDAFRSEQSNAYHTALDRRRATAVVPPP